jgi:hypothetical protein
MLNSMKKLDAVTRAGSAVNLARILGISRQAVSKWGEEIPPLQVYRLRDKKPAWFRKKPTRTKS